MLKRTVKVVSLLAVSVSLASVRPVLAAETAAPAAAAAPSKTIVDKLQGIMVVSDPRDIMKTGTPPISGVQLKGVSVPDSGELTDKLMETLGKPLTEEVRGQIVNDIVLFYRSKGRAVVDVTTPPQELTGGVLQVLVLEGKVGKIRVEGAKWFKTKYSEGQIRALEGSDLNSAQLNEDLAWINRNPFRQVDLVYMKGSELGRTDLVLREVDAFPVRVYTGYEDSGTPLTSNYRLLAGVNWGNVFGLDGQVNYQYMTDPEFLYFKAHSLTYIQPLPWRHTLTLLGSYATTHGNVPAPFDLGGFNWQTSVRYEVPLPDKGTYRQALQAGFDYKRANNNLAFGGISVFGTTADTVQWSLGYNSSLQDAWGATTLRGTVVYSPGGVTPQDTNAVYNASRAGATANYTYGKLELNRTTGLPYDFMFVNLFTFQMSDANLLASEQLGFGGYDTIRGYDTRVVNADQGYILSNELRSPPMPFLSRIPFLRSKTANLPDKLQFIGFVDYGGARDKHALAGERPTTYLLGVGPGLRYTVSTHLSVRADYGWQLLNAEADRKNSQRWHVGVVLSY